MRRLDWLGGYFGSKISDLRDGDIGFWLGGSDGIDGGGGSDGNYGNYGVWIEGCVRGGRFGVGECVEGTQLTLVVRWAVAAGRDLQIGAVGGCCMLDGPRRCERRALWWWWVGGERG